MTTHPMLRAGLSLAVAATLLGCAGKSVRSDYSRYVWPPPPDEPRIQLEDILRGRSDVEADSKLGKALLGTSPQPYDWLAQPFGVAFDGEGRILVTDTKLKALLRFDRKRKVMDVLGTRGSITLVTPLGVTAGGDGVIYVADAGQGIVVAYTPAGDVEKVYGRGELQNPTDVGLSPDGRRLFVPDSKAHRIVVFDLGSGEVAGSFGRRGEGEGEFAYPTSLAFDPEGNLLVVDQLNARVEQLTEQGRFLDQFGQLGVGFANFVRPKDVAVDRTGLIFVSDAALNNVQVFDVDFTLLTFVGRGGEAPGQFHNASGLAVRGDQLAVADQLNRRVQIFRLLTSARE